MKIPIYQSLIRHKLLYGMERLPAKILAFANLVLLFQFDLISSIFAFNVYSLIVVILMVSVNIFCIYALRQMAKYDPQLIGGFLRSRRYQKYYTARSSVFNMHARKGLFIQSINWKG